MSLRIRGGEWSSGAGAGCGGIEWVMGGNRGAKEEPAPGTPGPERWTPPELEPGLVPLTDDDPKTFSCDEYSRFTLN